MLVGAIAAVSLKGQVIHPALWVQLWFEHTGGLQLYVEALSAAHVEGADTILDLEGIHDDRDKDTTDDD